MGSSFFGSKKENHALGIDIGKSSIKAVQLKRDNDKIKLETYGEIALGPFASQVPGKAVHVGEEVLLEAMAELFKEAKISSTNALFSIDPSATFVTTVSIPKVSEEELISVIPFEARKYLPVPVSEVELDHWLMPEGIVSEDERSFRIVLAAIKHETLGLYSRLATRLGVAEPLFEIEGFSLLRSSIPYDAPFTLLLDIGSQFTTVTLVHKGVILDMHLVPRGSQDSTVQLSKALSLSDEDAEDLKRRSGYLGDVTQPYAQEVMKLSTYPLFGDIGRLLLVYERKYNQVVEEVVLTGGGARVPGVLEACKDVIRAKPRIVTPFDKIEAPAFLHELLTRVGPSYGTAIGLALKGME